MNWLDKLLPPKIRQSSDKHAIPEGLWFKCPQCGEQLFHSELKENLNVCPKCSFHQYISARDRMDILLDKDDREELALDVSSMDPLKFKDSKKYPDRLKLAAETSREAEALIVMQGRIKTLPVVASAFEFKFMAGSMGSAVGERFVRGVHTAIERKIPFLNIAASGGARMQEGLLSLMQMAKTNAALTKLAKEGLPYISVLTNPSTGGVSASFAFVGDVVIAEPGALIGFAGPRVIENTVREKLPEGFQRSEFLLEKGAIDMICDRRQMRDTIANMLTILQSMPSQAAA